MTASSPAPLRLRAGTTADVTAAVRHVGGRPLVWIELLGETASGFPAAPLSSVACDVAVEAAGLALRQRVPLVVVLASPGADIVEGIDALEGWGRLAKALADCSGLVPTILVVDGPAVSGTALLLGLADLVVMTEASYAFVSGPVMVEEFTGVRVGTEELGAASSLARRAGVPSLVVADRAAADASVEDLLGYLPSGLDELPPRRATHDAADRACPELGDVLPASASGSYDVRAVAAAIVDDGALLELRERWAPNVVTALGALAGWPVGVVANQPLALAGTLDIPASQKAARFVAFCDAFNLPILTLVDTPGFCPGKDLEWRGMIRHGAQLVHAYGRSTVPRVAVILRKSYGGAYIVMDSKTMGNDVCLAWPSAELAVMGAGQAAAILRRGASAEARAAFEADYEERLLNPYVASERGYVDAVIDPAETRRRVVQAFAALADKREVLGRRKHGNEPL